MAEHPANAVRRKKDSSIVVGCRLVKEGRAQGFFSAGSTGACLAAGTLVMGRIKGVDHGDMLPRGDAYMTAWMRFWLCGDQEAARCFIGDSAEILRNEDIQDLNRKGL